MSVVIRVKDQYGSFFCGFKKDENEISGILLSREKKNAIQYDENNDDAHDILIKIIQLTKGEILGGVQKFDAAPNVLK